MGIQSSIQTTLTPGSLGSQEILTIAGSVINSGDVVVNTEAGTIFQASDQLTIAQNNSSNANAGPIVITAVANVVSSNITMNRWPSTVAQLGSGDLAIAYSGGSTLTVTFRSLSNNVVTFSPITISESVSSYRIRRINRSSFVVAWASGTSLRFAIYSNDGSVVLSPTTITSSTQSSEDNSFNVACLNNGNIVFAFQHTSNSLSYAVYNSTGGTVLATTTVESSASPLDITVLPQTSGGFIIYYYRSAATAAWKFARYDESGTIQGSLTTVSTTSSGFTVGAIDDNLAIELRNGNIVFQATSSSGWVRLFVYSSTGTLITSNINITQDSTSNGIQSTMLGICATSFGFAAVVGGVSASTSNVDTLSTFRFSGLNLTLRVLLPGNPNQNPNVVVSRIFDNGDAGYTYFKVLHRLNSTSGPTKGDPNTYYAYDTRVLLTSVNTAGSIRGSQIALQTNRISSTAQYPNSILTTAYAIVTFDGSIVPIWNSIAGNSTFPGLRYAVYAVIRKSILGIALQSANPGQSVRVATAGAYIVNQSFTTANTFDLRTATTLGTRGSVIRNNLLISGII